MTFCDISPADCVAGAVFGGAAADLVGARSTAPRLGEARYRLARCVDRPQGT